MEDETNFLGIPPCYRISKEIRKGALGRLFLGFDEKNEKNIIIKLASPLISEDKGYKTYVYDRWAEKEKLFEHPNIARIVDVGKSETYSSYFAIAEYPGDKTLASEVESGTSFSPERIINILYHTAEALRAAHRRDIVHGHLNPSDIYFDLNAPEQDAVKVMFIDLAVELAETGGSLISETFGRPKYMAPEVIQGKRPTSQSDIFALGIVGYELLTGQEPFHSKHPLGYFFANCNDDITPPHEIDANIPNELSLTILRCLERSPLKRYKSMQRVIDDLDRCKTIIQTGTCEVVPRGTDSALARDYELPPIQEKSYTKQNSTPKSQIFNPTFAALILAATAVIITLVLNLPGRSPHGENNHADVNEQANERHRNADETVHSDPAQAYHEDFMRTLTRWERRFRPSLEFEQGIDDFEKVIEQWEGKVDVDSAKGKLAEIYEKWAKHLQRQGEPDKAEEFFIKAAEYAPENSPLADTYAENLPSLMLDKAKVRMENRNFDEALELLHSLTNRFPDTDAAGQAETLKPNILMAQTEIQYEDTDDVDSLIQKLEMILNDYPDSDAAAEAGSTMLPELYLQKIKTALEQSELDIVRKHLDNMERFPDSDPYTKAQKLEAELIYRHFVQLKEDDRIDEANSQLQQLFDDFHEDTHTFKAAILGAGYETAADKTETDLTESTASGKLEEAIDAIDTKNFIEARELLESIVTQSPPELEDIAREALWLLPECCYKSLLYEYNTAAAVDFESRLKEITERFPFSEWAEKSSDTLEQYRNTPDGMAYVPAGKFTMGSDKAGMIDKLSNYYPERIVDSEEELHLILQLEGFASEMPAFQAETTAFYIDIKPVTNKQYAEFVNETGHQAPENWPDGKLPENMEDHPVVYITLEDAESYAQWAGKRLPTEAEWEKAARGVDARLFPWGNEFDEAYAHHLKDATDGATAVGSYPEGKSPYGLLDMIGNVCEWTSSAFLPYSENSLTDHRAPYSEEYKAIRSGAWDMDNTRGMPTTTTRRFPRLPEEPASFIGFRCVKDVE